jgi:hypothetical protein
MALRTAEGRQAIEELVASGGKKQMVFGQYFGGPTGGAVVPAPAADKATTRFMKAAAMAGTGPSTADKHIGSVQEVRGGVHQNQSASSRGERRHVRGTAMHGMNDAHRRDAHRRACVCVRTAG